MTTAPAEPSPWTKRIDAYSNVPEPIDTGLPHVVSIEIEPVDVKPLDFEPSTDPGLEPAASETSTATELEPEMVLGDREDASAFAPEIKPFSEPWPSRKQKPRLQSATTPGPRSDPPACGATPGRTRWCAFLGRRMG